MFNVESLSHAIKSSYEAHYPAALSPLCHFEHYSLDRNANHNIVCLYFSCSVLHLLVNSLTLHMDLGHSLV